MDVRCPQCQTLYELDARQVSTGPVTLKCSQCQHVFKLEGRGPAVQENTRRWMIRRQKAGDILYLNSFDTLHEWIMKRECRKEDEISRTGNKWATLGTIAEFGPLFSVVESISRLEGPSVSSIATRVPSGAQPAARTEQPTPPSMPAAAAAPPRERVRTAIQYAGPPRQQQRAEDITKRVGATGPSLPPSPHRTPVPVSSGLEEDSWTVDVSEVPEHETTVAYAPRHKRARGRGWIVAAGLVLVIGGAGYAWLFHGDSFGIAPQPEKKVVTIGEVEESPVVEQAAPDELIDRAVEASLSAAARENDAVWTLWHQLASAPFYVALDTAYAAADEAAVYVERDVMLKQARVALENGQNEDAKRSFEAILAQNPKNATAMSGLGWSLLALGRTQEAAEQFRRAIDVNPEEGDAYIGLGSSLRQLGDDKAAYNAYDRYLGRFPRGPKASIASYQMEQLRRQLGL